MAIRTSEAVWTGGIKDGSGKMKLGSGAFEGAYSFGTRMGEEKGTNPEELIGAAHAGCFSMALAAALGQAGASPSRIHTTARVHFGQSGGGWSISKIELSTEVEATGVDDAGFRKIAEDAKANCPVSRALTGTEITLDARLAGVRA